MAKTQRKVPASLGFHVPNEFQREARDLQRVRHLLRRSFSREMGFEAADGIGDSMNLDLSGRCVLMPKKNETQTYGKQAVEGAATPGADSATKVKPKGLRMTFPKGPCTQLGPGVGPYFLFWGWGSLIIPLEPKRAPFSFLGYSWV